MKRLTTPLCTALIVVLLASFSANATSQTPLDWQTSEPSTLPSDTATTVRPYTVPVDPQAAARGDGEIQLAVGNSDTESEAQQVRTVGHLEAFDTDADASYHPGGPSTSQPASMQPVNPQSLGLQQFEAPSPALNYDAAAGETSDLQNVSVEPMAPGTVQTVGTMPVDSPGVQTVGTMPVDAAGVETVAGHLDGGCNCCPTGCRRIQCGRCSRCAHCQKRFHLFPTLRDQSYLGGWLQQGFTSNFSSPHNRSNGTVLFNDRSNDYRLNQLYFYAERQVYPNGREYDLGGRIDVLLGSDARFLTVPGLERHTDRTRKWNSETDDYGLALPQAYLEIAAPWVGGTSIKVGHFYSMLGYETAAAPDNFFYSHSYTFLYGEPFTLTGAVAESRPSDRLALRLGYTNGWDNWDSSSREFGVIGGFVLSSSDKRTSLAATLHSGKDVTSSRVGGVLLDKDRHLLSVVLQHDLSDNWHYVFQHDFGYQADGEIVVNTGAGVISRTKAKWYGINQYLIHDINDCLSSALRVEWFRDQDHSRISIPVTFNPGGPTFVGGNYVGVTGGFNWRPHPNVAIRPELRWDYSDLKGNGNAPGGNPGFRAFDDNTKSSQGTAALDLIVLF